MYNVEGIDLMNFYIVTQCILMFVACSDALPINDHWKYVYLMYANNQINFDNFRPFLLEFALPFIYFSSCMLCFFVLHSLLRLIVKNVLFEFVKCIRINSFFVISWNE